MSDKEFILAAAQLSRAAPDQWGAFMVAFVDYVDVRRNECVQAPIAALPTAQGRAQALVQLEALFNDCRKTAESIDRVTRSK